MLHINERAHATIKKNCVCGGGQVVWRRRKEDVYCVRQLCQEGGGDQSGRCLCAAIRPFLECGRAHSRRTSEPHWVERRRAALIRCLSCCEGSEGEWGKIILENQHRFGDGWWRTGETEETGGQRSSRDHSTKTGETFEFGCGGWWELASLDRTDTSISSGSWCALEQANWTHAAKPFRLTFNFFLI